MIPIKRELNSSKVSLDSIRKELSIAVSTITSQVKFNLYR